MHIQFTQLRYFTQRLISINQLKHIRKYTWDTILLGTYMTNVKKASHAATLQPLKQILSYDLRISHSKCICNQNLHARYCRYRFICTVLHTYKILPRKILQKQT